jgi:hypothetical protein
LRQRLDRTRPPPAPTPRHRRPGSRPGVSTGARHVRARQTRAVTSREETPMSAPFEKFDDSEDPRYTTSGPSGHRKRISQDIGNIGCDHPAARRLDVQQCNGQVHRPAGGSRVRASSSVTRPAGGSRVRASSSVTRPAGSETTIRVPSGVDAMAPKFWGLRGGKLTVPKDDDLLGQRSSSRFDVPESVVTCFATHDGTPAGAGLSDRTLIFGRRHLQNVLTEYTRHYNGRRPHRGCNLRPRRPTSPSRHCQPSGSPAARSSAA